MPENLDSPQSDIVHLSFEDALAELEKIVRQIEDGRGKLDEAISSYERGVALKRHCESKLKDAQAKIQQITMTEDGIGAVPFSG
jgi:exodeoxyribonuclease VII small subunit